MDGCRDGLGDEGADRRRVEGEMMLGDKIGYRILFFEPGSVVSPPNAI